MPDEAGTVSRTLLLYDDEVARTWSPFTLTRPVGEILYGCWTLRARAERATGLVCTGHLTDPALAGFDEPGAPPCHGSAAPGRASAGGALLWSSRFVPDEGASSFLRSIDAPARLVVDGDGGRRTVGFFVPEGAALAVPTAAATGTRDLLVPGDVIDAPWNLVRDNPGQIARDVTAAYRETGTPAGVHRIGDGVLSLATGAEIEPGVVVDVRAGPVRLEAGVRVEGPARLVGPLHLGQDTVVFGGQVGTSSIGPVCKLRGEIADSVLMGFVNKAHDGYLGHALLGRWVNLGALTTNSDLKNNYGPVTVWTPDGPTDTGLMKVGCFLGDHVKTGIGTVLNTGTVVGPGSNLFGGRMPPTFVPPFSWGEGSDLTEYRLDKFLEVAERAMARRSVPLTSGMRGVLERAWSDSRPLRTGAPRPSHNGAGDAVLPEAP